MTHNEAGKAWHRDLLALAFLFGALNFFLLGRMPLANPDEARYADIPREMLAHGDWITPRLNDTPYFEKPPLVYWTVGLSRLIFGAGEFAARLTPALFGLGGILLTYAAGRRLHGREAGLAAAIVLGTSLLYFFLSRILLLDMAVSTLMAGTLFCFILGVREPPGRARRWLFYGLYASAALATLAKGLIGFLIPGAIMFLWLLVFNQWRRLRPLHLPSGLLLFLAIAAPWHVLAAQRNPEWANFYFVHEHWERFARSGHLRAEPIWYFLPVIAAGLFPWIGFVGGAFRHAMTGGWTRRGERADPWFFVTWAVFVFVFFSASRSKLIPYILPLFPALAVLIGAWFARCAADGAVTRLRIGLGVFRWGGGVLAVGLLVALFKPGIIADSPQMRSAWPFGLGVALILMVGAIAAPRIAQTRGVRAGFGAVGGTLIAFCLGLGLAAPLFSRAGTKDLALVARKGMGPEDRVYHYRAFFHDFVYYAERPVGLVSYVDELEVDFLPREERAERFIDEAELRRQWAGPTRVWLVVRKRDQKHATAVFNDPEFRYHLIAASAAHNLVSNQP